MSKFEWFNKNYFQDIIKVYMNSSVTVEPLKWSEVMKFLALRQKVESETDNLALSGNERKSERLWFSIGRLFANRKWLVNLIAKDGDEFVGYVSIFFAKSRKMRGNAYLVLGVRSNYRGKGIGTMLMKETDRMASSRGIRRLELEVFAKNTGAHKLFSRLGYEEEGRKRKAAETEDGFDDLILMAKFI